MKKSIATCALTLAALCPLAAIAQSAAPAKRPGLCLAMRGNGFRIAAHFGAMGHITEKAGLPDAIVGSSSGSISSFILDSVAMNPLLAKSGERRNLEASLLLKAVPEYVVVLSNEPSILAAREIAGSKLKQAEIAKLMKSFDGAGIFEKMATALKLVIFNGTVHDLMKIYMSPYFKEVVNPEVIEYWKKTGEISKQAKAEKDPKKKAKLQAIADYRGQQLKDAAGAASKFDVRTDVNLLFRAGLLNHKGFVRIWDRIASLYAGYNMTAEQEQQMKRFLNLCAPISKGRTFDEVANAKPECRSRFQRLAKSYLKDYNSRFDGLRKCRANEKADDCVRHRSDDKLGESLDAFVITSAFVGDSSARYTTQLAQFDTTTDKDFGSKFKLKFADFRMGLFGNVSSLDRAKKNFSQPLADQAGRVFDFRDDFKAKRLHALGQVTWLEAIAASTAEAGQGRPQAMLDARGKPVLSLGGWPDPNPVYLLKGLGCETSIPVVTAIKPGFNFGEQVMRKVFSDITGMDSLSDEDIAYGNQDFTSDWGKWRNHANPNGAENLSFQAAEAVYCSQWDEFNALDPNYKMEQNFHRLAKAGYDAKLFIPEDVSASHPIRSLGIETIERSENVFDAKLGRPIYNGCVAPAR